MADAPPQLGEIPQQSELNVPTMKSQIDGNAAYGNGNGNFNANNPYQNVKETLYHSEYMQEHTQSAVNKVQHHPATQSVNDTLRNGPVLETVKDQHAKTTSEFRNLAGSRVRPDDRAATGQPLTHYHSFFYNLLSWENPRATTLSFLSTVLSIFAMRYLPALRWVFKGLYLALGASAAAEVGGKVLFSQGLASSFRPRKYYTIPRESLEASLEDVEQLINFFVIEFQRVLFAENLARTLAAFLAAFTSYWLIKFVPFWGLSLIAVSIVYLAPLVYVNNKEMIDQNINKASQIINSQASQVKEISIHHAERATSTVKAYAGDYSAKAQNYIGGARGRSNSPEVNTSSPAPQKYQVGGDAPNYSSSDFPHAPKQEPTAGVTSHQQQYEQSQFGGQAQATAAY